jgi:hypothetical protein
MMVLTMVLVAFLASVPLVALEPAVALASTTGGTSVLLSVVVLVVVLLVVLLPASVLLTAGSEKHRSSQPYMLLAKAEGANSRSCKHSLSYSGTSNAACTPVAPAATAIPYHTIPYHTIPYHTMPSRTPGQRGTTAALPLCPLPLHPSLAPLPPHPPGTFSVMIFSSITSYSMLHSALSSLSTPP